MPQDGRLAGDVYDQQFKDQRKDANKAPLATVDAVEDLINKCRGQPAEIRAGIVASVLGLAATAAALSMIPFESNFGSELAGRLMDRLVSPAYETAVNGPLRDYLDNLFPTKELAARQLVQGIETGALTDQDLIESAVDGGLKDGEIKKLLKIAKVNRFEKETAADYNMLSRYQDAAIAAQLQQGRDDVDAAIKDRQTLISEYKKLAASQALEVTE